MSEYSARVYNYCGSRSLSHSPPRGGAGSLPDGVKLYSLEELKRVTLESISMRESPAPDVFGGSYVPLDKFVNLPSLFDDSSGSSGEKVAHSQYKLQKRLLSALLYAREEVLKYSPEHLAKSLFEDWDNWRELGCPNLSTGEYHSLLSENPSLLSNYLDDTGPDNVVFIPYLDYWVAAFRFYLDTILKTWLHIPVRVVFDASTGFAFINAHYLAHPTNQFFKAYKDKKLATILKFKLITEILSKVKPTSSTRSYDISKVQNLLTRVDPAEYPHLYGALKNMLFPVSHPSPSASYEALLKLKSILEKPLLFITITMGNDDPVLTFIKYKQKWNHFFTELKRLMKSLGWEYHYYVKGVETTKSGRLHVHLVFLGVDPSHDDQLYEFKLRVEDLLHRVGFGYINDIQLVKSDYNLLFRSETDLRKEFYDETGKKKRNFTILRTFTLPYGVTGSEIKEATIHFIKVDPEKRTDNWERVVNYCFKYPLKGETYEDVKDDDDKLSRWLRSNVLFWVFGIKRWLISRDLTKLINEALPTDRRLFLFKNEWDFLAWLKGGKSSGLYSTIKALDKFEAFVLDEDTSPDVSALLAHPTIASIYYRLGILRDVDTASPALELFRVEGVVPPEVLESLIHYDLFNSLISLRYGQLVQLTTQQGVVGGG